MSSSEGQEARYTYKFTFAPKKAAKGDSDPSSRAEVQDYINELLGIGKSSTKQTTA